MDIKFQVLRGVDWFIVFSKTCPAALLFVEFHVTCLALNSPTRISFLLVLISKSISVSTIFLEGYTVYRTECNKLLINRKLDGRDFHVL